MAPRKNRQKKRPKKERGSHGRNTQRQSEIESRRVVTRQHSTARGASYRG